MYDSYFLLNCSCLHIYYHCFVRTSTPGAVENEKSHLTANIMVIRQQGNGKLFEKE